MPKQTKRDLQEFVRPLYVNGLHGRMLRLPPKNRRRTREILVLYGIHSSLERMFGLAEELNKYGAITMPDMPGIGGMESFYKIGEKPTLDAMADYMAAFVKMHYKRRRVTIVGFSLGLVIATRMLQKYPELTTKVDIMVSVVGFAHKEDFKFTKANYRLLRYGASLFSNRFPAWVLKTFVLRAPVITGAYHLVANTNSKLKDAGPEERAKSIKYEIELWKSNDIRTYMDLLVTMLTLDICNQQVKLPLYHVAVDSDQYFENALVEQHLGVIYSQVDVVKVKLHAHMPTIAAEARDVAPFVPRQIRQLLARA